MLFMNSMSTAHLRNVDLNLLLVLDDLLETNSTVKTARRLGRTQSAISHALARLRSTVGDSLFVRAGSTLRPTAAAEEMRVPVKKLLASAESILARARPFDPRTLERTFTIACTDYVEILVMPVLLPVLRVEAPSVSIVTRSLGGEMESAIMNREIDLAYGTRTRPHPSILEDAIDHEEMVVLLRDGHPALDHRWNAKAYAALDHLLVAPRGTGGGVVDVALAEVGLTRPVVLRLPNFASAALIVAQTDLVVTLPASFARRIANVAGIRLKPAPVPIKGFSFKLLYNASVRDDPAHAWFRSAVLRAATKR